jgi:hypothetical protein
MALYEMADEIIPSTFTVIKLIAARADTEGYCLACTFKQTVTVRWLSLAQGSNKTVTRWKSRKKG